MKDLNKRVQSNTRINSAERENLRAGLKDFAAIDFETANNECSSVCSVGIVIVRNGEIVDTFYSLIQPEPNYYNYWCSQVHGLCQDDTEDAPVFPKVWAQIEPLIEGLPLVAHNKLLEALLIVFALPAHLIHILLGWDINQVVTVVTVTIN